ncbi:amidohydrolase family protein [Acidisoma cellulosilytica]|uniref:Amidohydrolase family protein n=1 Tax=Acidisoma cellulosilyticum TaxID=2802395 RepID=A0A963Z3G5_9PROT|nr:amidohydrolase family protein [Acidisoma cellulosilyticum]MCB8882133.1 amidohydrolase family protein [Acidisoma cellulosilyticum]
MTMLNALTNARLADGRLVDILIAEGRIARIDPAAGAKTLPGQLDLDGKLVVPGFVDGHVHLDKTLLGLPLQPHQPGGSVAERIALEKALLSALPVSVESRAQAMVAQLSRQGTTVLRSHVDIDTDWGLSNLQAILRVREAVRDVMDIQIVAFPQNGIIRDPGTAALLDQAVAEGADLIGGLDPAGIDGDINGHLDIVFGIAERRGVGVDIHLHDGGALGCFELRDIAARTIAGGLHGRVAVAHAFALGSADDADVGATADALARAGVAIMTNEPGPVPMPPVKRLRAAGVTVFAGCDNIRDAWSPYGNGDLLERAMLIGYRQGMVTDAELDAAFALATTAPAKVLGLDADYGVAVGAWADIVALQAASVAEALVTRPGGRVVLKRGRLLHQG